MRMMLILLQGCALPWPPENCIEMWKAEKAQVVTTHCDDHDETYDDYDDKYGDYDDTYDDYYDTYDDYHTDKYDGFGDLRTMTSHPSQRQLC